MTLAEDLLVADFNQCFAQMRHYDEAFRRTLEFSLGGIASVVTASGALLGRYGTTLLTCRLVGTLLLLSSAASLLLIALMARNRVYFAIVAKFVNAVRSHYIGKSPGGFSNPSKMHCDHRLPKIFSPGSTQSIQLYFLSTCSSLLFSAAVVLFHASFSMAKGREIVVFWVEPASAALLFLLGEIGWVLFYWRRKQRSRTADTAVSGR